MDKNTTLLLPMPRAITYTGGNNQLAPGRLILLAGKELAGSRFSVLRFQKFMRDKFGLTWEITASEATSPDLWGLAIRVDPEQVNNIQGYKLSVSPRRIDILAHDESGVFYAICTLIQLVEQSGGIIPCLQVTDWPDFPVRGVMLDVSRDKVPSMETLRCLIDMLSGWKINQFQLYTEHTFKYYQHPEVWAKASPISGEEILELDAYCRERQIELVPNQNSFGHMNRWLVHPRYSPLAEVPSGFETPWGHMDGPFSLCPLDSGSLELVYGLYDELLPHFSSRMFNVGCDETFDLGQGRSKQECERRGKGQVYLDFLLNIYRYVTKRDYIMQFWGDIILQHTELIPQLPKDVIALEWGYEADHPFEADTAQFSQAGIPFYVCPGTSSWNSVAGRTDNTLGNLLNAAENGLNQGAIGFLNTDWGDNGHWQFLPVSYLGYAAGAAYSWSLASNRDLDIPKALDLHAFKDQADSMGKIAYDLGNIYKSVGFVPPNSSALFMILQYPLEKIHSYSETQTLDYEKGLDLIGQALDQLKNTQLKSPDSELILKEYEIACRLLRHACWRGMFAAGTGNKRKKQLAKDLKGIIQDYQQAWLARNRPGGLVDSLMRMEKGLEDYQT